MKRIAGFLILVLVISCGRHNETGNKIISVSIGPFKYFLKEIAGDNFEVNVMVPPGSNPHIYEPYPDQINKLRKSVGYVSNGYLGFEMTWLDRFYEINRNMKKLSLGNTIEPIAPEHNHDGDHSEGADPHYWVSPVCAMKMASAVRDFIIDLDPLNRDQYTDNFNILAGKILKVDSLARELTASGGKKAFMIYHPNLAYLARDYGLEEIAVENDGKEPSPSRLKELIDVAKADKLKIIMVQREYDTRNARAIAGETGSRVVVIDPLSDDWYSSTTGIIETLKESFAENF
ncbi:MAG TPA: zinc ABC transporter substrate-binding protein [Bacteroidales bacterium]|nr:zinc ABC transporter substrate-binding protein [Bacteroidales bacterium]HBZ21134.1 zinc ABC transporter substrate-binding protein [Bacteroidales bacterium]